MVTMRQFCSKETETQVSEALKAKASTESNYTSTCLFHTRLVLNVDIVVFSYHEHDSAEPAASNFASCWSQLRIFC